MNIDTFIEHSKPFIQWLLEWQSGLKPASLQSLMVDNDPRSVGIVSVDVIEGFCTIGPLSSPRVNQIVEPIANLFKLAWDCGVRDIVLTQDAHPDDAVEFGQYPPHCIRSTPESETVTAFKALPFFDQIKVFPKNCINSGMAPGFGEWVSANPQIKTWIAVGDCTDLCTDQLAMYLRLSANQNQQRGVRVVLPVNTVDTYDLPVSTAAEIGGIPHDADFLHLVFLYHMMINGVEIVSEITP